MTEKTLSERFNFIIYGALLFLTVATYALALVNLGAGNTIIALAIAAAKALLIILYFMHVRYSAWLMWAVVVAGLLWLGILFVLMMNDYLTRAWS